MARDAKGAVTSFRWSELPQDAERLCVEELARSPSSSCQDRGVCRERNPVKQSSFSDRLWGSGHTISWTEALALGRLLSSPFASCTLPASFMLQASPPALPLSQSTSSRKPSLMSQ